MQKSFVGTRLALFLDRAWRLSASGASCALALMLSACGGSGASTGAPVSPPESSTPPVAAAQGPCDILQAAGTPCVAAHSTVRALFAAYTGRLYQVQRSDGETLDIGVVAAGGAADSAQQDTFCASATCTISVVYDQSPQHNDLSVEGRGTGGDPDVGVNAAELPVMVGGRRVYGLSFDGRMGYRNDLATGLAKNGEAESMMMVTSARHTNALCCFDYGNAEVANTDTGDGHEDALYIGTRCKPGASCLGSGPWVAADLENGLYQSAVAGNAQLSYRGETEPFVTAFLKNDGQSTFVLRSANSQQGPLMDIYSGPLPTPGYTPMHQEGAVVLGTGGDNSNGGTGLFFEGWVVKGLTTTAVEDAVQANIVAAGYAGAQ